MKKTQRQRLLITLVSTLVACPLLAIATELSQPIPNYLTGLAEFTTEQPATPSTPLWQEQKIPKTSFKNSYAETLGWVSGANNLCQGYYQEPTIVVKYPHPGSAEKEETTLSADLPSLVSESGISILQGNVTLTQPGRQITANKAYLTRNAKTGKITLIDMLGDVHIREAGKLLVAEKVHLDLRDNSMQINEGVYRFSNALNAAALNAWGTIKSGHREPSGVLELGRATYSTCPPTSNAWRVIAERLHLDKEKGEGQAYNSFLEVKNVPVFYSPYFTFPLDNRRKSGFLFPTYGYSSPGGVTVSAPYYLNLAPNYDATITPALYSLRGLQGNLNFRYLTDYHNGAFNFSVLPDDSAYQNFKSSAAQTYAGIPNENVYLSRLNNSSNTRAYASYIDSAVFNPHWSSSVNLNYVNDDYYFQDFGPTPAVVATDQLLNQGDVTYMGNNWNFLARLQGYQTLHPINDQFIENQYSRLPELDLNADYPNQGYGLDYQALSQFVYFDQQNDFLTGNPMVTGQRYNFAPAISWPMANMSGYFDPKLQLETTFYNLKNQPVPSFAENISRVLPIFDIDSGLFFDRSFNFLSKTYRETLEPRLFYLYVPNKQQDQIPLFDTTLPPFSFEQMFQTNRFTGIDRIGDANQITGALTTRFLNSDGEEKLRASVGEIFLFQQHQVECVDQGLGNCVPDPTRGENISPIVGELSYDLNPVWSATSDLAWDPNSTRVDNGSFNLIYNYGKRLFNIGYYFVRNADVQDQTISAWGQPPFATPEQENVDRINLGLSLPITEHWSALADWNYNLGTQHSQVYFYGAEYDSCCWATRFVMSRTLTAVDQLGRAQFNTAFYIQFQLKGLANFGYNNPSNLIASMLPGYKDEFITGFKPLSLNT